MAVSVDTYDITTNPLKPTIVKDDLAVLDYSLDWTAWLAEVTDTINTFTPSIGTLGSTDGVLTIQKSSFNNGIATAWLQSGTIGQTYQVKFKIITANGRTDERSIYVKIKDR